jgi:hypothetical protein
MGEQGVTLVIHDGMIAAIAGCVRVNEVKDIRDKATALAAYYKQSGNHDAENGAINARHRAGRRAGELLQELPRAETPSPEGAGGRGHKFVTPAGREQQSPYARALVDNGISTQAASRLQAMAQIPDAEFERASAPVDGRVPSAAEFLRHARKDDRVPVVSDEALSLWGHFRDIERQCILEPDCDHQEISGRMTERMRADIPSPRRGVANDDERDSRASGAPGPRCGGAGRAG